MRTRWFRRSDALPHCSTCGRSAAPRARFCGDCGGLLSAPAPSRDRSGDPDASRVARTVAAAGAIGVAMAVVLAGATRGDRADPEVALPEARDVPSEPALSPDDAAALRQQVDEDRLRCEPRGCELWRRAREDVWGVVTLDDAVVLLEPGRLVALDGTTGQQRWVAPVADVFAGDLGPAPARTSPHQHLFAAGDAVLVAGDGRVALVDEDGERRWETPSPVNAVRQGALVDGMVALQGWDGTPANDVYATFPLLLLSATDGRILLEHTVSEVHHVDDRHVVVRRGAHLEVLDPDTGGRVRWRRPLWREGPGDEGEPALEPIAEVHHVGDGWVAMVVAGEPDHLEVRDVTTGTVLWQRTLPHGARPAAGDRWVGVPDGARQVVLDAATGREITAIEGVLSHAFVRVGDHAVTVLTDSSDATLLALDGDGEVVWRVALPERANWRCCAWLRTSGQVVTAGADDERVRVDVATGEEIERWSDRRRNGTGYFLRRWYTRDGTRVEETAAGVTLEGEDGHARVLPPGAAVETADPWLVSHGRELLGVRLMPDG